MKEQGSAGNVIAALMSFFIPGLGQLIQGRLLAAAMFFIFAAVLWTVCLGGWIIHIWSVINAARFGRKQVVLQEAKQEANVVIQINR